MSINRRDFLRHAATASAAVALTPAAGNTRAMAQASPTPLPSPGDSGIEHIVVVMMESRSFDHLMGWLPGANGTQAGLSYMDSQGIYHPTYELTDFVGCSLYSRFSIHGKHQPFQRERHQALKREQNCQHQSSPFLRYTPRNPIIITPLCQTSSAIAGKRIGGIHCSERISTKYWLAS